MFKLITYTVEVKRIICFFLSKNYKITLLSNVFAIEHWILVDMWCIGQRKECQTMISFWWLCYRGDIYTPSYHIYSASEEASVITLHWYFDLFWKINGYQNIGSEALVVDEFTHKAIKRKIKEVHKTVNDLAVSQLLVQKYSTLFWIALKLYRYW